MSPEFYGWALVSVLLIVFVVALFCLWSRSQGHDDEIAYLKDCNASRRDVQASQGDVIASMKGEIATLDESAGLLEQRVAEIEARHAETVKDINELWTSKNDLTTTADRHEKRLNDQMNHILGFEKKMAVLQVKADATQEHALLELKTLEIFHELVRRGTWLVSVDEEAPTKKTTRRGKR